MDCTRFSLQLLCFVWLGFDGADVNERVKHLKLLRESDVYDEHRRLLTAYVIFRALLMVVFIMLIAAAVVFVVGVVEVRYRLPELSRGV